MLCLSGFDLYSRWVPLNVQGINSKITCFGFHCMTKSGNLIELNSSNECSIPVIKKLALEFVTNFFRRIPIQELRSRRTHTENFLSC